MCLSSRYEELDNLQQSMENIFSNNRFRSNEALVSLGGFVTRDPHQRATGGLAVANTDECTKPLPADRCACR